MSLDRRRKLVYDILSLILKRHTLYFVSLSLN